ncbi:hypothetical protein D3C85_1092690 [compost metagenome]
MMDQEAAGGADRVVEDLALPGQPGLLGVARRHGTAPAGVARGDGGEPVGEQGQRLAKGLGRRLGGEIVRGGAQAAAHQHHLGAPGALLQHGFQIREVVPHCGTAAHLPALLQQQGAEPGGIGVHHQARDYLVSRADDLDTHAGFLGLNRLAGRRHGAGWIECNCTQIPLPLAISRRRDGSGMRIRYLFVNQPVTRVNPGLSVGMFSCGNSHVP